jgi:bla regulator protein blaR1
MTASLPFTADLIQAFGWALLHSFWQALLVYACLRLVLLLWPQASSSIKYNLSFISLTGIFSWFIITLWQQLQTVQKIQLATQQMIDTGMRRTTVLELPAIYHSQTALTSIFPHLEFLFPLLTVIYVSGVAVMTIKLIVDLLQLRQIRRKQVLRIDPVWEQHLEKLLLQLQLSRKVKLLISEHIQVPVMIGFLKPLIILPVIMFNNLTAEQLEAILLHELAHIKRNDYLLNIFQSIVETILFFNPFIWLISKNIRIEREHCCDDLVISGQVQPLHYAKALVALEEYRLSVTALAMAAANNKQHLFNRIKRIMDMKTKNINYTQKLLAVLIIALGLVSIAWLNPAGKAAEKTTRVVKTPAVIAPAIVPHPIHFVNKVSDTLPAKQQLPKDIAHDPNFTKEQKEAMRESMAATEEAMKNIDWKKINEDVQNAMKEVNWTDINKSVNEAMKTIDWDQINKDIKESTKDAKDIDIKAIQEGIRIGMESAKAAMANVNSEDVKNSITIAMKSAQQGMAQAQVAMAQVKNGATLTLQNVQTNRNVVLNTNTVKNKYNTLIEKLAADKLIDTEKGYTISVKDGVLNINGENQVPAVTDKYRALIRDVKELNITGKKDDVSISVNE